MSLLGRIVNLETAAPSAQAEVARLQPLAELTDEELDRIVVNLLLAGPEPTDPATLAIWERATTRAGPHSLTAAEFDALYRWLTAEEGDVPEMLGAAMPRVSRPLRGHE